MQEKMEDKEMGVKGGSQESGKGGDVMGKKEV